MVTLKKIIIISGIVILLVLLVLGAAVGWVIHRADSPEIKRIIAAQIAKHTGYHVELGQLRVGLSDAEITNVSIPIAKGAADHEKFLRVQSIKARYRLLDLLNKPLIISKLEIEHPVVIVRQDAAGELVLPAGKTSAPQATAKPDEKPFTLSLPEITVRNAQVTIFAHDQSVVASVDGADLEASYEKEDDNQHALGNLKVASLTVTPGLTFSDVTSTLTFNHNRLTLNKIQAVCYGGLLIGEAALNLDTTPGAFTAKVNLSKTDMSGLLASLGGAPDTIIGKLDLNFDGGGSLDAPKKLTGKGDLLIAEPVIGKLKSYQNLTSVIGTIGGISALREGRFDNIKSVFTIMEQKVRLLPLEINSPNLSITLSGLVDFDQNLDLKGEVLLAPGLLQVAQTVENIIGAVNAIKHPDQPAGSAKTPGQIKLPVSLSGPATDPKISLNGGLPVVPPASQSDTSSQEKTQSLLKNLNDLFNKKKTAEPEVNPGGSN